MEYKRLLNRTTQYVIPGLTICAQFAIALHYPEYGLILNLLVQPFWVYSGWKSYKEAGQIGIFVTSIILTIVMIFGVVNYWLL